MEPTCPHGFLFQDVHQCMKCKAALVNAGRADARGDRDAWDAAYLAALTGLLACGDTMNADVISVECARNADAFLKARAERWNP